VIRAARLVAISLIAAATALPVTAAHAADGSLTAVPATGMSITPMTVVTSGPCPSGDFVVVRVFGKGFPRAGENVVGVSAIKIYPTTPNGGFELPLQNHMKAFAERQSPVAVLSGRYEFVATCRAKLGVGSLGEFRGSITFTSPTRYTSAAKSAAGAATAGTSTAPAAGATKPSAASDSSAARPANAASPPATQVAAKSADGGGLASTGGELARLALIGALAVGVGIFAVRRARSRGYLSFGGR
jgi:hypothetical protein